MAKDYEDKMEDMLEKEEMESSEVEVEVNEEVDVNELVDELEKMKKSHKDIYVDLEAFNFLTSGIHGLA